MAWFKKFDDKENISGVTQMKSSVIRKITSDILSNYPAIAEYQDIILPKKEQMKLVKCHDHIEILTIKGEPLFFKQRGDFMPTLRLLHKFPFILPPQQVDKGAVRFVLSGANIMCPGLTSKGAILTPAEKETVVALMAEGKEHALAIGIMKMSADEIKSVNKGIGIDNVHYLNDGLWQMKTVK
ncbi:malignant T-cell-amplified sequence 1-B-like [Amphiura filiformis]|uniref:malignant T-cell-amplified sequence 1-B-like n=1 Tax=Amphiura filiformis TaxID=82378 RepID=UPI003B226593